MVTSQSNKNAKSKKKGAPKERVPKQLEFEKGSLLSFYCKKLNVSPEEACIKFSKLSQEEAEAIHSEWKEELERERKEMMEKAGVAYKAPINAYMRYKQDVLKENKALQYLSGREKTQVCSHMWHALDSEQKKKYQDQYEMEREEYDKNTKAAVSKDKDGHDLNAEEKERNNLIKQNLLLLNNLKTPPLANNFFREAANKFFPFKISQTVKDRKKQIDAKWKELSPDKKKKISSLLKTPTTLFNKLFSAYKERCDEAGQGNDGEQIYPVDTTDIEQDLIESYAKAMQDARDKATKLIRSWLAPATSNAAAAAAATKTTATATVSGSSKAATLHRTTNTATAKPTKENKKPPMKKKPVQYGIDTFLANKSSKVSNKRDTVEEEQGEEEEERQRSSITEEEEPQQHRWNEYLDDEAFEAGDDDEEMGELDENEYEKDGFVVSDGEEEEEYDDEEEEYNDDEEEEEEEELERPSRHKLSANRGSSGKRTISNGKSSSTSLGSKNRKASGNVEHGNSSKKPNLHLDSKKGSQSTRKRLVPTSAKKNTHAKKRPSRLLGDDDDDDDETDVHSEEDERGKRRRIEKDLPLDSHESKNSSSSSSSTSAGESAIPDKGEVPSDGKPQSIIDSDANQNNQEKAETIDFKPSDFEPAGEN
jgi:hypothetical protein